MLGLEEHLCTEIKNVIKLSGEDKYHESGEYIYVSTEPKKKWYSGSYVGVALLNTGQLVYYWNNRDCIKHLYDAVCVGKGRHHHVEQL